MGGDKKPNRSLLWLAPRLATAGVALYAMAATLNTRQVGSCDSQIVLLEEPRGRGTNAADALVIALYRNRVHTTAVTHFHPVVDGALPGPVLQAIVSDELEGQLAKLGLKDPGDGAVLPSLIRPHAAERECRVVLVGWPLPLLWGREEAPEQTVPIVPIPLPKLDAQGVPIGPLHPWDAKLLELGLPPRDLDWQPARTGWGGMAGNVMGVRFDWLNLPDSPPTVMAWVPVWRYFIPAWIVALVILIAVEAGGKWLAANVRGAYFRRRGRCERCGYSRSGMDADVACPECGTLLHSTSVKRASEAVGRADVSSA